MAHAMTWFSSKKSPSPAAAEPVEAIVGDPATAHPPEVEAPGQALEVDISPAIESKAPSPSEPALRRAPVPICAGTRLGDDTTIIGGIVTTSSLWIAGRIEGDIASGAKVVIAAEGSVVGDIGAASVQVDEGGSVRGIVTAANVDIAGVVQGAVRASARLAVAKSARVQGDVTANSMQIDDGATLQGRCTMVRRPTPGPTGR